MPCLPTRAMKAPSGEQWVHEVKHDGYRLMARKVDGRVRLLRVVGEEVRIVGYVWATDEAAAIREAASSPALASS